MGQNLTSKKAVVEEVHQVASSAYALVATEYHGLTVAQTEYDAELKARREAEAEVTRLRVLLSGQAVRLTAISGETKRQEAQRKLSREMSDNLSLLERNISKLKVERDLTLAEMDGTVNCSVV